MQHDKFHGGHRGRLNGTVRGAPRRSATPPLNETPRDPLDFATGDVREGHAGDIQKQRELREEFPPARVREAGMTGGELPENNSAEGNVDSGVTADDLSPETLLDAEPSHSPDSGLGRSPQDSSLSTQHGLAGGRGLDEAEMAEKHPIGQRAARATKRKVKAHARDINAFEPHERAVQAEIAKGRKTH